MIIKCPFCELSQDIDDENQHKMIKCECGCEFTPYNHQKNHPLFSFYNANISGWAIVALFFPLIGMIAGTVYLYLKDNKTSIIIFSVSIVSFIINRITGGPVWYEKIINSF